MATVITSSANGKYFLPVTEGLVTIDELGFKKLPGYSADDFFEIISKRYEQGSLIITTNKTFEQWTDIFTDGVLAATEEVL